MPTSGACGDWMQNSEYVSKNAPDVSERLSHADVLHKVVALNSPQLNAYGGYQNGKPTSCYKSITISAFGKQSQAVIKDGKYTPHAFHQPYSSTVL